MKTQKNCFINNIWEFIVLFLCLCVFILLMAGTGSQLSENKIGSIIGMVIFGIFGLACIISMFALCEVITVSEDCMTYKRAFEQGVIFYENVIQDIVIDDYHYKYGMTGVAKMWKITDIDGKSIFIVYSKRREKYIEYIQSRINIR